MKFTDGIKAVKEERRSVIQRLKQLDSILAGFAGLTPGRQKSATPKAPKIKRIKVTRKPRTQKATSTDGAVATA